MDSSSSYDSTLPVLYNLLWTDAANGDIGLPVQYNFCGLLLQLWWHPCNAIIRSWETAVTHSCPSLPILSLNSLVSSDSCWKRQIVRAVRYEIWYHRKFWWNSKFVIWDFWEIFQVVSGTIYMFYIYFYLTCLYRIITNFMRDVMSMTRWLAATFQILSKNQVPWHQIFPKVDGGMVPTPLPQLRHRRLHF